MRHLLRACGRGGSVVGGGATGDVAERGHLCQNVLQQGPPTQRQEGFVLPHAGTAALSQNGDADLRFHGPSIAQKVGFVQEPGGEPQMSADGRVTHA